MGPTAEYAFDFAFLEKLGREGVEWTVAFYEIESTQEVVGYMRPDPVPARPMFNKKAWKFWGAKESCHKVDLKDVSEAMAAICDKYAGGESDAAGSEPALAAGAGEDGLVDEYEDAGEEPKSELDKLVEQAAEEDLNLGVATGEHGDGGPIDLLKELSESAGDGSEEIGPAAPPLPPP